MFLLSFVLALTLSVSEFGSFKSDCGYVVQAKDNGGNKKIIVVGEYHRFPDVQKDVECLMKQLAAEFKGIEFVGKEGVYYRDGLLYSSSRPKLNLGIPLIGLESERRQEDRQIINEIDHRHAELARKKLESGLTLEEHVEYEYITNQSYNIIVRKRSWEWVDNLQNFMGKNQKSVGLINVGFGHFLTLAERFEQYNISYIFILPNAAKNYVSCEAYWQKRKPAPHLSTKAVCDDQNIKPFWD